MGPLPPQRTRKLQPRDRLSKTRASSGGYIVIPETVYFRARTQYPEVSGSHPLVCAPDQGSMWELKLRAFVLS